MSKRPRLCPSDRTNPRCAAPLSQLPDGLPGRWGLAIFTVAMLLRALYLLEMRDLPLFSVLMGDGVSYNSWARRIAAGEWYGKEVFYQTPMYPYFLAVVYRVCGSEIWTVRLVQTAISSASCVLLAAGGVRWFDRRVGIATGLLAAAYGPSIFFCAQIQKPVLAMLFIALLVYLLGRMRLAMRPWLALTAGMTLAGLALTRENTLILIPIVACWLGVSHSQEASANEKSENGGLRRARAVGLMLLGVSLVLLPVGFRNKQIGGRFLLTTAQMGPNFYIGNNPAATGSYVELLPNRGDPKYEQQDAIDLAQHDVGRKLTPSEVSRYWMRRGLNYVRSSPAAWSALAAKKFAMTFGAKEIMDTEAIEAFAESSLVLGLFALAVHFGVIGPLALAGLWLTRRRWRELWVLYAMIGALAVSVAAFYVLARYRYPIAPLLMLFASAGTVAWFGASRRERLVGAALAVVGAVALNWPVFHEPWDPRAVTYQNVGLTLLDASDYSRAEEQFRRVLEMVPPDSDLAAAAHKKMAMVLSRMNRHPEAVEHYQYALAIRPDRTDWQVELADVYAQTGRMADAMRTWQAILQIEPDNADVHFRLANALAKTGQWDAATQHLRHTVRLNPRAPEAVVRLAWLLATHPNPKQRAPAEAMALALRANELTQNQSPLALGTLAGAQAATGDFDMAVVTAKRAIDLARRRGEESLARFIAGQLKYYERGEPYVTPTAASPAHSRSDGDP